MTRMCLEPAVWYCSLLCAVMFSIWPSLYHITRGRGSPVTTHVISVSNPRPLWRTCFSSERISVGKRTCRVCLIASASHSACSPSLVWRLSSSLRQAPVPCSSSSRRPLLPHCPAGQFLLSAGNCRSLREAIKVEKIEKEWKFPYRTGIPSLEWNDKLNF